MGFAIHYSTTEPVAAERAPDIQQAVQAASRQYHWLSCEPVMLSTSDDGILYGISKPNFLPHPADRDAAELEETPDGTLRDLIQILCDVSIEFGVDWELDHDFSDGPVGYIRRGSVDPDLLDQLNAIADLGEILSDLDGESFDDEDPPIFPLWPNGREP